MWIHEHSDWPHLTWDEEALSSLLIEVRYQQGRLLGKMDALGFAYQTETGLEVLTEEIVKSSAIEGERLDQAAVRSSIAQRLGIEIINTTPPNRDVEGIVEMMLDATQKFSKPLTQARLFNWHSALFPTGRSGMSKITVGAWRTEQVGAMQVVSGPIGREHVHYEAPHASLLDENIDAFLNWFEQENSIDPILKSGVAHFWFVTIHPFEDGNGRIARAIADLALARADGIPERFYSLSSQIEQEKKEYYRQLEQQQQSAPNISSWLKWYLKCLLRALTRAEEIVQLVLFKAQLWDKINQKPVNVRQQKIINMMLERSFEGYMNTSKYAKLTKCSTDTALRDLQTLKSRGILLQNAARGRSTSYRLTDDIETITVV